MPVSYVLPYLVGSGRGLGGNRTVTRRQSGVSNRLQGALHRVSRATTPTPLSFPPTFYSRIQIAETEKYDFGNGKILSWSNFQLQEPCTASAGQQPQLLFSYRKSLRIWNIQIIETEKCSFKNLYEVIVQLQRALNGVSRATTPKLRSPSRHSFYVSRPPWIIHLWYGWILSSLWESIPQMLPNMYIQWYMFFCLQGAKITKYNLPKSTRSRKMGNQIMFKVCLKLPKTQIAIAFLLPFFFT